MHAKRLPNRVLIQSLARAGADDPLWAEFVERFRPRLRLVVLKTFRTEAARHPMLDTAPPGEVVDDLAQEVFLRLLDSDRRALSRFEGRTEASAYTYIDAIAVNLVRDHFKHLRSNKKLKGSESLSNVLAADSAGDGPTYAHTLISDGPGPERFVASSELRDQIRSVVDEMSPRGATSARDRLVFQLYFIEGLTVDEIAANRSIGLTPSGVEKCVRRIRDALKDRLFSERGR